MRRIAPALFPVLVFVLLVFARTDAKAQESEADLIAASKTVGLGNNPYHEALVLKHIKQIHQLRSEKRISTPDYQRLMAWHQVENLISARRAAASLGLDVVPQSVDPSKGEYRDGSDSDYHVRRKDGKPLTLEDVQAVERAYRLQVNQEVKTRSKAGGTPLTPSTQTFDTATDFMAAVTGTSEGEFNRIAEYFKAKGADTYSRYGAAVVESQLRTPGSTVDIRAGGMYVNEMIDQAATKQAKIDKVREQIGTATGAETQRLQGQLEVLTLERDKYIARINDVNTKLSQQAGLKPPPAVGPDSDWRNAGRAQYAQTLGNIAASSPAGSDMRRYSRFILALQISDLPENQRRAHLEWLDPNIRREVEAQVRQFQEQEQTRVSADSVARLQKFLDQTDTGRKVMAAYDWVFKELTRERGRVTQSSQFIDDIYGDVNATSQHVGNRAMQLSMWLDVMKQVRVSQSDADLAIALGRTFASTTYVGMIASYAYTGLVEGDAAALAKAMIILLCPQAALPQVVQSIGGAAIDLTSTILFDQQFLTLYAAATFDPKSGSLLSIGDDGGASAACQFLDDVLSPGGYGYVEGVFARALDLAKGKNLSVEMLSGANRAGAVALTRAFQSTVYGGAPQVMKDDSRLAGACGQVAVLTSTINEFVEGLGQPGTVPMDVDQGWTHPKLEPAAQSQLSKLLTLRSAAWPNVKEVLCDGIRENLETRHRAAAQLDKGDQELLDMLANVERLFRDLEMYDLGMSWLHYDAGFNFIQRNFLVSTKEQKLRRMEVLQKYIAAYSAVVQLRDSAEGTYVACGGKRLTPRLLTGTPLITADPAFDRATATTFVQEAMNGLAKPESLLLFIKRDALNDNAARLDADFDKRILGGLCSAVLISQNNEAVIKGVAHSQSRLYQVQVLAKEGLRANTEEAFRNISMQTTRSGKLIEEFKEYYKQRQPTLAILPPPAVMEQRAVADTEYAFRLAVDNVPTEAVVTWYEASREIGKGPILQHAFPAAGVYRLSVTASWVKSERVKREGTVTADLRCVIGEPGSDLGKKPALSIVLPPELAGGPGVAGKVYPFGVNAANIPSRAVYSWSKGLDPLKTGRSVELAFADDGAVNLSVSAVWVVDGSGSTEEVWARASFKVVKPPLETSGGVKVRIDGKTSASINEDIQLKALVETKARPLPQVRFVWTHGSNNLGDTDTVVFRQAQAGTYTVKVEVLTRIGATWVKTAEGLTAISVGRASITGKPPADPKKPDDAPKPGEKPPADTTKPDDAKKPGDAKKPAEKPPADTTKPDDAKKPGDTPPAAGTNPAAAPPPATAPGAATPASSGSKGYWKLVRADDTATKSPLAVMRLMNNKSEESGSFTATSSTSRIWGTYTVIDMTKQQGQRFRTDTFEYSSTFSWSGLPDVVPDGATITGSVTLTWTPVPADVSYKDIWGVFVAPNGDHFNVTPDNPTRSFQWSFGREEAAAGGTSGIHLDHSGLGGGAYRLVYYEWVPGPVPATATPAAPTVSLTVTVSSSTPVPKLGETVTLSAAAAGGVPPYVYAWTGVSKGAGAALPFIVSKPGRNDFTVTVTDAKGTTAAAPFSVELLPVTVTIALAGGSPRIPFGQTRSFQAKVSSPGGTAPPAGLVYRWQPNPEVTFAPFEGSNNATMGQFSKLGIVKVWVEVLQRSGTVLSTVAESDQLEIEVVKPELNLVMTPAEPYPGQDVRITVSESQAVGDAFITYWWEYAGSVLNPGAEANPRVYSFKPKDTTPVTVTAHAKARDGGDDLGTKTIVITARPHTVQVTGPTARGPKPQIWDPKTGLVDVEQQIAVFQDVSLRADVTPAPINQPLHYQWTVSPDGCAISNAISQEPTFNCSQTGGFRPSVTVRDHLGATLGIGTGNLSVSISQATLQASKAQADAAKLAAEKQGAAEAAAQQRELQAKRDTADRLRKEGAALQQQGQPREAIAKYRESLTYVPDPALERYIAQVEAAAVTQENAAQQEALKQQKAAAQARLAAEKQGAAEAAAQQRELQAKRDTADRLRKEGAALQQQGQPREAIAKYRESLTYVPDPALERYIAQVEAAAVTQENAAQQEALKQQKAAAQTTQQAAVQASAERLKLAVAQRLRDEGAALQQQGKLREAAAKFRESLTYVPDPAMEAHIAQMEAEAAKQAQATQQAAAQTAQQAAVQASAQRLKLAVAQRLRNEGSALQQQGKLREAAAKYRESLTYRPDPELETIIPQLEAEAATKDKQKKSGWGAALDAIAGEIDAQVQREREAEKKKAAEKPPAQAPPATVSRPPAQQPPAATKPAPPSPPAPAPAPAPKSDPTPAKTCSLTGEWARVLRDGGGNPSGTEVLSLRQTGASLVGTVESKVDNLEGNPFAHQVYQLSGSMSGRSFRYTKTGTMRIGTFENIFEWPGTGSVSTDCLTLTLTYDPTVIKTVRHENDPVTRTTEALPGQADTYRRR